MRKCSDLVDSVGVDDDLVHLRALAQPLANQGLHVLARRTARRPLAAREGVGRGGQKTEVAPGIPQLGVGQVPPLVQQIMYAGKVLSFLRALQHDLPLVAKYRSDVRCEARTDRDWVRDRWSRVIAR